MALNLLLSQEHTSMVSAFADLITSIQGIRPQVAIPTSFRGKESAGNKLLPRPMPHVTMLYFRNGFLFKANSSSQLQENIREDI